MKTAASISGKAISHTDLVRAAVLAPSPDNNQPWQFDVHGNSLLIHADRRRALPSDVGDMFMLLALGAAAENAAIAGTQMGFSAEVSYLDDRDQDKSGLHSVALTFHPGAAPNPLCRQLAPRCTCRKWYSARSIPPDSLARLSRAVIEFSCVQLDWVSHRTTIRSTATLVASGDRLRFEHQPFHEELFKQLRFSAEHAERTRDGLDVRTLELPPGAAMALRALRSWPRMHLVHKLGLGGLLSVPSALAVRRSGAVAVLTASARSAKQYFESGRALQRLWLVAQAEGIAVQPLGSLPIFFAHGDQTDGGQLSPQHRQRIGQLKGRFRELVPEAAGRTLVMLLRLGYAKPPSFTSLRRPIESFFETTGSCNDE